MYRHDPQHTGRSPYSGPSTPSLKWEATTQTIPAIAPDGTVYVGGMGGLRALNPDGSEKWVYPGFAGPPAIGPDGTVYVLSSGGLLAVSPEGAKKWESPLADLSFPEAPTVGPDGTIYLGSHERGAPIRAALGRASSAPVEHDVTGGSARLYAYNPNGTLKWEFGSESGWFAPAVAPDGTVYGVSYDSYMVALRPDGVKKWGLTGEMRYSPAIGSDGTVYTGGAGLWAIRPDGTVKWTYTPPVIGDYAGMNHPSVGADGTIYVGNFDGMLYAVDATGVQKWALPAGIPYAPPAIGSDGVIYAGSRDRHLYAVNPDGTQKWAYPTEDPAHVLFGWVDDAPAIGPDGTVYCVTKEGWLRAIESSTPPQSTSITIHTSSPSVCAGGQFILSGLVTPTPDLVGKIVAVNVKKPNRPTWTYSSARVVYAGEGGAASWWYRYTMTPGSAEGTYRFFAFFDGGADYAYSSSPIVDVTLGSSGSAGSDAIRVSATSATTGRAVILTGKMSPVEMVGLVMHVNVKKPNRATWTYSSNRRIYDDAGVATWWYRYTFVSGMAKGTYQFMGIWDGDADYPASRTPVVCVTLR